jgi:hypothetical protein
MFNELKRFVMNHDLKKNQRTLIREKHFFNFNTAQKIAVLFTFTDNIKNNIHDLIDYFQTKKIEISTLCYYDEKTFPENFITDYPMHFFCKKNVNWYGKPTDEEVVKFIKTPFDILIDFNLTAKPVIKYINILSVAKMKVGRSSYPDNPYDFILSTGEKVDHDLFVKELKHYLQTIDMKND